MNSYPGAWMRLIFPPDPFQPLEVKLPDASIKRAVWTGARWWCENQEVTPVEWRPIEPELRSMLQTA